MGFGLNLVGENNMQIETESLGLTIESMRFVPGEEPVFYAGLSMGSFVDPSIKGYKTNEEDEKHRLVSRLCDHLAAKKNPLWTRYFSHDRSVFPIQVVRGLLGRPHLLLGEYPGPAVSFSQSGDKVWAALCGDWFAIGIDVAESHEFGGEYPFYRVFHPQELAHALKLAEDDLKKASALLWSIKEAAVKALGCGFHLVDPWQIMVYPVDGASRDNGAYGFSVSLSEKAARRFPGVARGFLRVRSLFREKSWLSIALFNAGDITMAQSVLIPKAHGDKREIYDQSNRKRH
jgi:phosphopantetheinyl transferase (holo-ACP synthase)